MSAPKLIAAQAQRPNANSEVPQQAAAKAPQFTTLTARCVVLPMQDVDTDQIIPARFLKVTDKLGLGEKLFCDWRYLDDGSPNPKFILNQPEAEGTQILIAGHNFGCAAFGAIFVLDVPFPAIVVAAALIGHFGARHAPAAFAQIGRAHV